MAYVIKLVQHKLDLLGELAGRGRRPKFDSFDEGVLELLIKAMRCFDFEHVVAQCHDIRHSLHLDFSGNV